MINRIKYIANKIGIDGAILFTSASSLIGTFGSIGTVLLVINLLSDIEQGFFYTFGSIISVQIFFELGFNNIITQYAAHEAGKFDNDFDFKQKNNIHVSRLSSLLKLVVRWYSYLFFILFFILSFSGLYFFNNNYNNSIELSWRFPWIILVISSCINFIISPIIAFLIGIGYINEISRLQFIQNIIKVSVLLLGLIFDYKLYSLGISSLLSVLYVLIILFIRFRSILIKIWVIKISSKISYFKEIFPYQWKIAISWISGYFIFQMFNPILFMTEGPKVAGQMGMTLAALSGLSTLSLSWITTKIPLFSNLIATNKIIELRLLFKNTFINASLINFILLSIFYLGFSFIKILDIKFGNVIIGDRFIDYLPMLFMVLSAFLNQIISSWALYLRCFKKEPYLINSIVGAILVLFSTYYFGRMYGLIGITTGYLLITVLGFPWAYYIFKKNQI